MGRRKIAIEPITDERNRTVTFIKRKAGLFKKAHELAVLCQVDVAVLILGSNNTFYEFSSVDTNDLIDHYQNSHLPHDVKGPANYGNYRKKDRVVMHDKSRKRTARASPELHVEGEDEEEEDDNGPDEGEDEDEYNNENEDEASKSHRGVKNEDEDSETGENSVPHMQPAKKKLKKGVPSTSAASFPRTSPHPTFNSLQQQVQRQFHNLYAVASHPEATNSNFSPFNTQPNGSFSRTPLPNVYSQTPQALLPGFSAMPKNEIEGSAMVHPSPNTGLRSNSIPVSLGLKHKESTETRDSNPTAAPKVGTTTELQGLGSRSQSIPLRSQSGTNNSGVTMTRPSLRVQIPSSSGTAIKSEPSSASSPSRGTNNITSQFSRTNAGHIELPHPANSKNSTPQSAHAPLLHGGDKFQNVQSSATGSGTLGNGFLFNGLPSALNASPSIQQYFATPTQANPSGGNVTVGAGLNGIQVSHPHGFLMQRHLQLAQQHQGLRPQSSTSGGPAGESSSGPFTGSLPSKFANDLIVASPTTSMAMFQDWGFGRPSGGPGSAAQAGNLADTNTSVPPNATNNESSGLTPYINVNQTPLSGRYFIFGDPNDDKNKKS
ncbi:LADA_0D04060g1_1 [Lachancea dasiensis]|uniref:LADA_0D04060g1_1 n=1 Tax=Lachancea dasiensis TaxID=1072105 RepID=A0A1G4J4W0_9SACH|nr:LADA_0D04060g1_1 [Lachancea dasiensis]